MTAIEVVEKGLHRHARLSGRSYVRRPMPAKHGAPLMISGSTLITLDFMPGKPPRRPFPRKARFAPPVIRNPASESCNVLRYKLTVVALANMSLYT